MGCDIHLFIEYKLPGSKFWEALSQQLQLQRNYRMFSAMAGVRSHSDDAAFYAPRGIPEDASYHAKHRNELFVVDSEHVGKGEVARKIAEVWIAEGSSKWTSESRSHVTHPDWHSHSWLSAGEFQNAISLASFVSPDYKGALGAMRAMEAEGCECRVVFWFDN